MLTGIKIAALVLLAIVAFYTLVGVFVCSLWNGKGTAAAVIFYALVLGGFFGVFALFGAAFGL